VAWFFNEKHSVKASFAGSIYDLEFSLLLVVPVSHDTSGVKRCPVRGLVLMVIDLRTINTLS
jgi:hypothetical protein